MKKIIILLLAVLLSACSTTEQAANGVSSVSSESSLFSSAPDNLHFKERDGLLVLTETQITQCYDVDQINNIIWIDDTKLLIQCMSIVEKGYLNRWIVYDFSTNTSQLILDTNESRFYSAYDCSFENGNLTVSEMDGTLLYFDGLKLKETILSNQHNLSTTIDLVSGDLYYFDDENLYQNKAGVTTQIYSFGSEKDRFGASAAYPRAIKLSSDKKKLSFAHITNDVVAEKTVIIDLDTLKISEIPQRMLAPAYLWLDNQLFAITGEDYNGGTTTTIYHGEKMEHKFERFFPNGGFINFDSGKYGLGGNGKQVPLVFSYADGKNEENCNELVLMDSRGNFKPLLSGNDFQASGFSLSPNGKQLAFTRISFTNGNEFEVVVMDVPS